MQLHSARLPFSIDLSSSIDLHPVIDQMVEALEKARNLRAEDLYEHSEKNSSSP